jgi:hypothetical protein
MPTRQDIGYIILFYGVLSHKYIYCQCQQDNILGTLYCSMGYCPINTVIVNANKTRYWVHYIVLWGIVT